MIILDIESCFRLKLSLALGFGEYGQDFFLYIDTFSWFSTQSMGSIFGTRNTCPHIFYTTFHIRLIMRILQYIYKHKFWRKYPLNHNKCHNFTNMSKQISTNKTVWWWKTGMMENNLNIWMNKNGFFCVKLIHLL